MSKPVVLITGAGRRIGAALARDRAAKGWHVAVHYNKSEADAQELAEDIRRTGGSCDIVQADLADPVAVQRLIPECARRFGQIACLINNASLFSYDSIETLDLDFWNRHLASNLTAPALLARDFARQYRDETGGVIINLLDQKVDNLNPDFFSYTITKVGLKGLTQMLAMALAPRIRVCGISPGVTLISGKQTETSFEKSTQVTPLERSSTVEDLALAVELILSTPSMNGQNLIVDGGENLIGRRRDVAFEHL